MRIGTSRADRFGFAVFVALAAVLAVLLINSLNSGSNESAQEVSTFADLPAATAVPTTAALTMPEPTATSSPTPTPQPVEIEPAAVPETDQADDELEPDDASTADGDSPDQGQGAVSAQSAATAPAPAAAPAAAAVPNPQPAATAVPNPQPAATGVPNPQPAATAVPNPQPAATAVPNPQPAATGVPNPQVSGQTQTIAAPAPAPAGGTFTHTLTARVSRPTLYTTPGGSPFTPTFNGQALPPVNPTVFGRPLVYRVVAGSPTDPSGWAQVFVPARPNGTTAWVNTAEFSWGSSNRMLQINVSTNTVTVFEGTTVLLTTQAVTGKSSSPTPRASGWVEEVMPGPSSAYGPTLISLGIFSDALNSFSGAVPKIALHGTNNPGLMGQYASNGCIRVRNEVITQIAGLLPVGSKVQIVG